MDGDFVEFAIFPPEGREANLNAFRRDVLEFLEGLSVYRDYIWSKEGFTVAPRNDRLVGSVEMLESLLEDESFVLYLLYRISKEFRGCVIQVGDADGEFLLIEAAEYLPRWISPENSQGRVGRHVAQLYPLTRRSFFTMGRFTWYHRSRSLEMMAPQIPPKRASRICETIRKTLSRTSHSKLVLRELYPSTYILFAERFSSLCTQVP